MRKIKFPLFFTLALISNGALSQVQQSGSLTDYLNAKIDNMPDEGTDAYHDPNEEEAATFKMAILKLGDQEYPSAAESLALLGYQLVEFLDNASSKTFYLVEEPDDAENPTYGGTYIFCPTCPVSNVVIQTPHSVKDSKTGKQGIAIFYTLGSQWLMSNSAHRCNSSEASECSGTTSVCGNGSSPYPLSDAAHNDQSWMQVATQALDELHTNADHSSVFLQLHGFNKDSRPSDFPDGILSNGTRSTPAENKLFSSQLKEALEQRCGCDIAEYHRSPEIDQLGGTTNVQGRYLNESPDPCSVKGSFNSAKFLHFEQSADLRADFDLVLGALQSITTQKPTPLATKQVPEPRLIVRGSHLHFQLHGNTPLSTIVLYDMQGQILLDQQLNTNSGFLTLPSTNPGIYFYVLDVKGAEDYRGKLILN